MQKHQLDMWLHGELHKDSYQTPKVYVIGCSVYRNIYWQWNINTSWNPLSGKTENPFILDP